MTRWCRIGWLRVSALTVAIVGFSVAAFAYGASSATTRGIDPIEYVTRDFYYRMWTIVGTGAVSVVLLLVDAMRRVGNDSG